MRKLTLTLIAVVISLTMSAKEVTEQQALLKAQRFMQGKQLRTRNLHRAASAKSNSYYVFNAESNGGFVIVSGDDRTEEILGYSDKGTFRMEQMPENVKTWLAFYEQSIKSLEGQQSQKVTNRAPRPVITPLIKTQWNQYSPYNLQCPMDGGELSVTGCVATALAQVMYYHRWPQEATGVIPAYTTGTRGFYMPELPATTFKWDKMQETYTTEDTGEAADAVAELMRYCGQINEMNYTSWSSGASLNTSRLAELFGYSKGMFTAWRSDYYSSQWEDMIYEELANGRPVLYSGSSATGGHQFICDGYDENGLFHINWGWGGYCDGYFLLSVANPDGRGAGGGSSSEGYAAAQDALLGFKPAEATDVVKREVRGYNYSIGATDYTRTSINQNFENIAVEGGFYFLSGHPEGNPVIEYGWALCKDMKLFKMLQSESTTLEGNSCYLSNTLSFGADVPDGNYQLCMMYKLAGDSEWNLCENVADQHYEVQISGTTMKFVDSSSKEYQVNGITYAEDPCINNPLAPTISLTNTVGSTCQYVYFWIRMEGSLKWTLATSSVAYVAAGETGTISLSYTPTRAGKMEVRVTSDEDGNNTLWTSSVVISNVVEKTIDGVVYSCIVNAKKATVTTTSGNLPASLTIPATIQANGVEYAVTAIADYAFLNKNELEQVTISEGVKTIGEYAFRYCFGLQKLTLPSTLTKIGDYAFGSCTRMTSVTSNIKEPFAVNNNVFEIFIRSNGVETITPPTATLFVPVGTTAKYQTVEGWKQFATIYEGELKQVVIDNITYDYVTGSKIAIVVKGEPTASAVTIPASITVEGITYPVTTIGTKAFWNKNIIKELTISEGIKTIGSRAFQYCYGLHKLSLPSTLTEIGNYAFGTCENLTSVTALTEKPFTISDNVFGISTWVGDVETITPPTATLYVPIGTAAKYQAADGWKQFATIYEGELKQVVIDNITYDYVTGSKIAIVVKGEPTASAVTIPASITVEGITYPVTTIGTKAFWNKNIIKELTISEGIKTIGSRAFQYCYGLHKLSLPSTLTEIGNYAFGTCENLTSVTALTEKPFTISDNVFGISTWVGDVETITPPTATLYVPAGTKQQYASTDGWSIFQTIEEMEPTVIAGDANGDMKVNVSDIVEIVNDILGKPSAKYNRTAADVNGDGQVNVTDIVNVVNIIMTSGSK